MGGRIAMKRTGYFSRQKMADPQITRTTSSQSFRLWAQYLIVLALLSGTALAQAVFPTTYDAPPPVVATALPEAPTPHRFWDNENRALFATVAALSAA